MPIFDSFLADTSASFLGFLQPEHNHHHDVPDVHHHGRHDEFLGLAAAAPVATEIHDHGARVTEHSDFLFGNSLPTLLTSSKESTSLISPDKLKPQMFMMADASAFYEAVKPQAILVYDHLVKNVLPKLDPFGDGREEPDAQGWSKMVPRGLRWFLAADIFSGFVVACSLFSPCDVPLKSWLLGGILLGFPVSELVNKVAKKRPAFQWYRLIATQLRDGSDVKTMKLGGILFLDQFQNPVHKSETEERQENKHWFTSFKFDRVELVTGYQVVTAERGDSGNGPVSWVLEGSFDGVDWVVIDERTNFDVPRQRGQPTIIIDDMAHLDEASTAFRSAFIIELVGCAASFAWLVAGTSWVSAGTETCVDSAPFLWYPSYLIVVLLWSMIGTIAVGLIVSAVATIVIGSKTEEPR